MVHSSEKLLILDLDETLVYATEHPLDRPADFLVGSFHVYRRPHLDAFLAACQQWYRLAVWTSASPLYAAGIVERLFTPPASLEFLWASDRCTRAYDGEAMEYYWRKPMRKLTRRMDYPLHSILVIDDTPQKWEQSYGNLVRVSPFVGDDGDDELLHLIGYLDELRCVNDVRRVEKRGWRRRASGNVSVYASAIVVRDDLRGHSGS